MTRKRVKKGTIIRKEGQKSNAKDAWKFPKFHELLHIVDDMSRFGSPVNFCAQRPESLLIPAAKNLGDRHRSKMRVLHMNFRQRNV